MLLFLGSLTMLKWRQLFWIALCVLELSGNASGSPTDTPTLTATEMKSTSSKAATGATETPRNSGAPSSAQTTSATSVSSTSLELSSEQPSLQPSSAPPQPPGTPSEPAHSSQELSTAESPEEDPSTTAETLRSTVALENPPASSERPPTSAATTPLHPGRDSPKPITCHNIKEVSDTGAICLQLNESNTCKHFLEMKGLELWSVICEGSTHPIPSPCQIKLAKSEVDQDCMLLILVGERDPATDVLQETHWEKFGIKSLKRGNVRNHQDFSQKTLIALVTSGLLLAFLGLAGYFLMKRRSWSPAGERLAEDPYYTENGSQGNTMLMVPPQEQPELQEKPNLNGGTQENGTGQASSKNISSARQHSPADTEM
ncbi:hematopoietic progenitor cell antigen CD34 [Heliangelus exortis]